MLSSNAGWYFISGSNQDNHLLDILVGIACVSKRLLLNKNNCHIFIPEPDKVKQQFNSYDLNDISLFNQTTLSNHSHKNIVLVVTGHGNYKGISTPKGPIRPCEFINILKSIKGQEMAAVVLGQCFSGVFNYVDVRNENIAIVGATDLDSSLNWVFPLGNNQNGLLNVYLYFFFNWVALPEDVDGDGVTSLLDGHKFAGSLAVNKLNELGWTLYSQIDQLKLQLAQSPNQMQSAAITSKIKNNFETLQINQIPWLLAADYARSIIF